MGKGHPGPPCAIARAREQMSEDEHEVADMILADREGYPPKLVAESLTALLMQRQGPEAHPVSAYSVRWHQRGECKCDEREEPA